METNSIIDSTTASKILIWAVTIMVAGFIAQFGKKFANFLIEKIKNIRKKKSEGIVVKQGDTNETAAISPAQPHSGYGEADTERARLKLEKKKAKAAAKEQKKKS